MPGINYKGNNDRKGRSRETICDIHRDMYQRLLKMQKSGISSQEDLAYIMSKIEVAFKMGKSMDAKLRQYKNNYDDDWWQVNKKAWSWDELKK